MKTRNQQIEMNGERTSPIHKSSIGTGSIRTSSIHKSSIRNSPIRNFITAACLLAGMWLMTSNTADAQRRSGGIGIGGQIGEPSGVTLKVYNPGRVSYDFLAAWNLDDFFYLNVHGVYETHLDDQGDFHFFYGPGAFLGLRDRPRDQDDDVVLGISGTFGLNYLIGQAELFAQVTPRLSLVPDTDGDVGGGAGVRFYFWRADR